MNKLTVEQIRARFDGEVERFSNLETGQVATVDAPLALDLIAEAAAVSTPGATRLLDVGCGAGNYSLKLLQRLPGMAVTLVDLSQVMLDAAVRRVSAAGAAAVTAVQRDIRELELAPESFDVIVASAVLHHLRTEAEWEAVYRAFFTALAPGGSVWVFDLVEAPTPELQAAAWKRYDDFLTARGGEEYKNNVLHYIELEDTPRSVADQLMWLKAAGFKTLEVLHKHGLFAAFGAVKT